MVDENNYYDNNKTYSLNQIKNKLNQITTYKNLKLIPKLKTEI